MYLIYNLFDLVALLSFFARPNDRSPLPLLVIASYSFDVFVKIICEMRRDAIELDGFEDCSM